MTASLIAIEGIDATGKTTQVRLLRQLAQKEGLPWNFLPEFSNSCVGDVIKDVLRCRRFFALSPDGVHKTRLSETLLLTADWAYQVETIPIEAEVVITDRGPLSLIAYQAVRCAKGGVFANCEQAAKFIASIVSPVRLCCYTILLTGLSEKEIQRRVQSRGETPLTKEEMDFLWSVEALMKNWAPRIGTSFQLNANEKRSDLVSHIAQIIRASQKD